ncbi:MAG: hypothetical protein GX075_12270, partial [Firmicutes bacterium]|nr:hypothetical protein [Bacillota bacterium]
MSQFSRFDAMLSGEMKDGAAVVNQKGRTITDPRSDLTEDSVLWSRLLALAKEETERLNNKTTVKQKPTGSYFGVLHGFRCA